MTQLQPLQIPAWLMGGNVGNIGKYRKPTPEEAASKAAERAVKAAAKLAPKPERQ